MKLKNYALGQWVEGTGKSTTLFNAVTGEPVAEASSGGLDFKAMAAYARSVGGPKLRAMTFHERALMLKAVAKHLTERKDAFYAISAYTGATKIDSWIDIDGGFGTFFAYASRGRREFPNETFHVEGPTEPLSKGGTFVGRHICVPLEGVAMHINAFNFPVWGMMEKLAPTLLAGVPAIVKPATATSYLTEAVFKEMIASGILPEGAVQLICGSAGDLLDHVTEQDAVAFTGSAATGRMLKESKAVVANAVRFNMEADSLNCAILAPDAAPGTEEFDLFIKEVVKEMTVKAGQKCTAVRRTIVPNGMEEDVIKAIRARLERTVVGDPSVDGVRMGPLASKAQVRDVGLAAERIRAAAERVVGGGDFAVVGADREKGAFYQPELMYCADPLAKTEPHDVEAFGPVNTVMPYRNLDEAIELARRGRGSLCGSLVTADPKTAQKIVLGVAPYHGRLLVLDKSSAKESTGHGSPLPNLVHGGPGRAGGGEEMGGARGVLHYMQRTAVQGSPSVLTAITREWTKGAAETTDAVHPFRKTFDELHVGDTLLTGTRTITLDDIVKFAELSGDRFYAHMNDDEARSNGIFEGRVAHGYFIVSAAAGLFVEPSLGPVLANYGLENLRFTKPVYPGDTIQVRLTVKQKTAKDTPEGGIPQGVVEWDVEVMNQHRESVAIYSILTLVRRAA
ncbi:MAG TPA: phenylacetic acid degradation bifunctional protein PaaZ [Gemmatimonadaceae bacterium]|nr:phenylacetic acid degradation bifunctional protein PaaZ [Gemmatimonadaceae bacterium]HRQ77770.1 phenylacetic acid degradation bifunctional protein PaaZ [Gemmatimonadaceae bacterium]